MRPERLKTKRHAPQKGTLRRFHANVRQRRQRVATSAEGMDFRSEVPNIGLSRAVMVIFVLHLIAIAGLIIHNNWFEEAAPVAQDENIQSAKAQNLNTSANALPTEATGLANTQSQPMENTGFEPYFVRRGDSYESIAAAHGIRVEDLRAENPNARLVPGRILRMPAVTISPSVESLEELGDPNVALFQDGAVNDLEVNDPFSTPLEEATETAVLVKPQRPLIQEPAPVVQEVVEEARVPRAVVVDEASLPASTSGRQHTVKAGETIWRIARNYKVKESDLLSINGMRDARHLQKGQVLKIPARR